jgi:Ca-activated chloride channel family protein
MRHLALTITFIASAFQLFGQLTVQQSRHDFGDLYQEDSRSIDFQLTNTSDKVIYIIRADVDKEMDVKYTTKSIQPDSTAIMRVQINPAQKGSFRKKFPLHHGGSMEPIYFTVEGKLMYTPGGVFTPCPDFSGRDPYRGMNFELIVHVTDSLTTKPIHKAKVQILKVGIPEKAMYTSVRGYTRRQIMIGGYYFILSAEGYQGKEFPRYVNKANARVEVELVPLDDEPTLEPELTTVIPVDTVPEPILTYIIPVPEDTLVVTDIPDPIPTSTDSIELPRDQFRPNNVVFLVDVSTSMKQKGRLDLLKASMIELVYQLRDIDQVAIVAYSSNAGIVLDSRSAGDKDAIIEAIKSLKAGGSTEGGKGIRKAYLVAQREFIQNGNNQVIIATDGSFDQEGGRIIGDVKRNAKKGISISVVGVINERWTEKSMKTIAKEGHGNYIHIETYEQSKALLVDEIKMNSKVD